MRIAPALIPLGILAIVASLVVPLPIRGRAGNALLDLGHAPAFGLLAIATMTLARPRWRRPGPVLMALVWGGLVALGVLAEGIQALVGRHPSLHDAAANALGVLAGLIWAGRSGVESWTLRLTRLAAIGAIVSWPSAPALTVLVDAALQPREMPVMASFETAREMTRWYVQEARSSRSPDHATHGSRSLRLDLGPGTYPGATLDWPVRDWSHYWALRFDAYLAPGPPLDLAVKIKDEDFIDGLPGRFERVIRLAPGSNRATIPLTVVAGAPRGRRLDLRRIGKLQFFVDGLDRTVTVHLDDVRLE